MKKILLLLFICPVVSYSQFNETYKEFNFGVITDWKYGIFPGASYLWGKTHYYNNNTILDYQAGIALPTIVTGKIGFGVGGSNFATIIGIRAYPTTAYIQFGNNQRFNFQPNIFLIVGRFLEKNQLLLPMGYVFKSCSFKILN